MHFRPQALIANPNVYEHAYLSLLTNMLNRVTNKVVRGPTFVVSIPDIHRAEYREDEKVANVEIEGGFGLNNQVNWLIYSETLRGWDPPHEDIEMDPAKLEEILSNISKSLELLHMPHKIV